MSVTILDGGMGQELVARCPEPPTGLWATKYMIDHPDVVRAIHDDYFAAGAQIATTNTYAIFHDRLEGAGLDARFDELHRLACRIAVDARNAHGSGRVAGSLGPLGWSYDASLAPPPEAAAALYAEVVAIHRDFVDLHILETMAGVDQARGGLMGCTGSDKPVWLSISVDDADGTRIRSGEPLEAVLPLVAEFGPEAILVNCSKPEAVTDALPVIARANIPFGAYANGFTSISDSFRKAGSTVAQLTARRDLGSAEYAEFARTWANLGATIIGGCCEVGPAHIAEVTRQLCQPVPA